MHHGYVERRGRYGFDAPYVPILLALGGVVLLALAILNAANHADFAAVGAAFGAAILLLSATNYVYTTRRGKFIVWHEILSDMQMHDAQRVLDIGCGRGALLLLAAQRLSQARFVGVDLWKTLDQSGNSADETRQNAMLEQVADRVELLTADMRQLPFADNAFDLVMSSLAVHNIPDPQGRAQAIAEAYRVVRPGGRVMIADIRATNEYDAQLAQLGATVVTRQGLGWRFFYGGPWMATSLVTATKV